jgi:flavin-dependent dehydrogenase
MSTRVEVAIIGAGPGGALAAWQLARAGMRVALFEKHAGPVQKVCGEFISAEGLPFLAAMGLDLHRLGAEHISHVRLHGRGKSLEAQLPQAGAAISRFKLDELMIESAWHAGAQVHRGQEVRKLQATDAGFTVGTGKAALEARALICATGKFDFPPVQQRIGRDNSLVGIKVHLRMSAEAQAALQQHVDLFVFKDGYGGLVHVEDGLTNLCFLIKKRGLRALGREWPVMAARLGSSCPALAAYLSDTMPAFWPPVSVANVPYGFVRETAVADNLYCVGDQLAVIPSFAGEGMTIAMRSAKAASEHILRASISDKKAGAKAFHQEMAAELRPQVKFGYRIHQLLKSPRLTEIGTAAARLWPKLVDYIFQKTRLQAAHSGQAHQA